MPEQDDHRGGGAGGGAGDWPITSQECRLSGTSYSAPVFVDIEYLPGSRRIKRSRVMLTRLPIMLRSNKCVLSGKSEVQPATISECPLDAGVYFAVKGTEKVVLVQKELRKNRILVKTDSSKRIVPASVAS